jgi:hypothetical protein
MGMDRNTDCTAVDDDDDDELTNALADIARWRRLLEATQRDVSAIMVALGRNLRGLV